MWDPQIILSDDDDDDPLLSPIRFYSQPKKPRIEPHSIPNPNPNPNPHPIATAASVVLVVDDDDEDADPTPRNRGPTSATSFSDRHKLSDSGIDRFICLESDNESEGGSKWETEKEIKAMESGFDGSKSLSQSTFIESTSTFFGHSDDALETPEDFDFGPTSVPDDIPQTHNSCERDDNNKDESEKRNNTSQAVRKKKMTEEEKARLKEEKKSKQLQEKLRKQALKAEAAESRKVEREKKKWENGKNALKSIVAEIDTKVIEMGSVGGNLLTRFAEKGINYRITSNPIERSILWTMKFPEHIQELSAAEIRYVLLVYDAEEFCNVVTNGSLFDHVFGVQSRYPTHTACYLTNRLMSYVNKREQEHYKSPTTNWRRPPVEEVLAKLTTQFNKVHSRQCADEAELAEHIAGLTLSLASCQFRKKLTRLCVNANGSVIPKDSIDKNLIKDNLWLKVLVAIPKVQPRFAVAIWKKYPTMKSLLMVYMDPTKSVHEKEFLLKDLKLEGLLGEDRRLGEVCSKRMYRILMAKSGSIKTDDVEDGADFF